MQTRIPLNSGIITLALSLTFASAVRADFSPITITSGSYNQDVVVEKTATVPLVPGGYTTASMDGGTNNNGDAWYEMGYCTNAPTTGIPTAGSTITSESAANHQFKFAPSYTANDAILIDSTTPYTNATFTFTSPAPYAGLSLLTSGGNGGCTFKYTVHHQDGSTEIGNTNSADWFFVSGQAFTANGRINAQSFSYDNTNSLNPRLYAKDIVLANTTSPVTSVDLAFVSSSAGAHTCFMAISGATTLAGNYNPINVTGYNADIVVEASAPQPTGSLTNAGVTTATMDNGTLNTGDTWFEKGYVPQALSAGLPAAGGTVTNAVAADHRYTFPPSYVGNDAIYTTFSNSTANITFASPASYSALSFLTSAGHGPVTNALTIQHADGSSENNTLVSPDWFSASPIAFNAQGRVNVSNKTVDNVNNGFPRLFAIDISLANTVSPVTNIVVTYQGTNTSPVAVVFAVSGAAGAVAPIYAIQPPSYKVFPGSNLVFSASVSGTAPITYQWQKGTNGVYVNLSNGGNVAGATTDTLTLSNVGYPDRADYRLVASNVAGTVNSNPGTLTVLSLLSNIVLPGDTITGFGLNYPSAENPTKVIDGTTDKYLNFGANNGSPFLGPVGVVVTPSQGRSIVTSLRFYAANDTTARDPANYTLEGSVDGSTYTLISSNVITMPDARNTVGGAALDPLNQSLVEADFANTNGYTSYKLSVYNVKNLAGANSMQVGEVEFLGVLDLTGFPSIANGLNSLTAYQGSSANFSVTASGNPAPTFQWQKQSGSGFLNLSDNANVFGSQTTSLTLNSVDFSDAIGYRVIAANTLGSITSSVATLRVISTLTDVTAIGDPIIELGDQSAGFWGTASNADNAIDAYGNKYVNGGSGFSAPAGFAPFSGPVGLIVTPSIGTTLVSGLRIYTADGNVERDPADYTLEGSNDGNSFTVISSGALALPADRNSTLPIDPTISAMQEILFANSHVYSSYRITFQHTKDDSTAAALQFGELELLGVQAQAPPTVSVGAGGTPGTLVISSSQPGTLLSATNLLSSGTIWASEGPINGSVIVTPAAGTPKKFYRVSVP
ncbi:immunoglobulin domain-containing protein [Pedosphaera parvula]|uniref:Immunoglobulin I-set domain protein n=1 Tax=Pedosphaera parvula (strain Ellin514) TaxID=320771 RepID=B9XLD6_PEDPL|nr:immunoglobulin domain-containing protein [Pedosphaera parvula]EEF59339.1 Immunoglobulin I-set domain protein [Pedosphaera parvula Ellin514]